ncbi:MAG: LuxR C-terminal-related transcriptional regulator [Leptospirales bacterium]
MELSAQDYRALLDLICQVHLAPNIKTLFRETWESLRHTLELTTGAFIPADRDTGHFQLEGFELFDQDSQYLLEYFLHFSSRDPIFSSGWFRNFTNEVVRLSDFDPPVWVETSEYARGFQKRTQILHIMGSNLGFEGKPVGALRLHREDEGRQFTERDMLFLRLLAPHLSQAIDRFIQSIPMKHSLKTGIIIIHQNGTVFLGNRIARQILGDCPIANLTSLGCERTSLFPTEHGLYRILKLPLRALRDIDDANVQEQEAQILLLEPFPLRKSIRERLSCLGLSLRQSELTALVLQGKSNREIGNELGISEQTVKDHLFDIFDKFEIKSRYQLIFFCVNAM